MTANLVILTVGFSPAAMTQPQQAVAPAKVIEKHSEEDAMRPEFRKLALVACRAIQRIPVLEESAEVYDSRLKDAETSVDKTEFEGTAPMEKKAVFFLKAELIKMGAYRIDYDLINGNRDADNRLAAFRLQGPALESNLLLNAEIARKAQELLVARISSDNSLNDLFEALKIGRLPEVSRQK